MSEPVLDGWTVGITADRRADEQAALFERRGASVLHGPTIRTLPVERADRLAAVTDDLLARPPAVVLANTGIGVRSWFGAAESSGVEAALHDALAGAAIFARGPKASAAVHGLGLDVVARGRTERLSEIVDLALGVLAPGDRVALQLDGAGAAPTAEVDRLRGAGAEVVEVPVYEWRVPEDHRPALRLAEAVVAGRVHAVTFTAGPQVRNWLDMAAEVDLDAALLDALNGGAVVVGCVGPVCLDAAVACGLDPDRAVVPPSSRLGPLVRAVTDALVGRAVVAGRLVLRGSVAVVDGARVELTDTEARLLAALAARDGAVVSKPDLLADAWGDPAGDPHVVEVTVARLRRRLGRDAIGAVPRRGYRLAT